MNNIYNRSNHDRTVFEQRYVYDSRKGSHRPVTQTEPFIKGPINLEWISKANALPGKAGPIGLGMWYLAGLNGSFSFKTSGQLKKIAACERKALYSGIMALEQAGLIKVDRRAGSYPFVEIIVSKQTSLP